jgi:hypothetical protein
MCSNINVIYIRKNCYSVTYYFSYVSATDFGTI